MVRSSLGGSIVVASLIVGPIALMVLLAVARLIGATPIVALILLVMSVFFVVQGLFAITWMLYGWSSAERLRAHAPPLPVELTKPKRSFTALLAARHEEAVIDDTIRAIAAMDYPEELCELLVLCKRDDPGTIAAARRAIRSSKMRNARVVTFSDGPTNKPAALNRGLAKASGDVVVVFDAEDEPHRALYRIVNTTMQRSGARIVQCGVQLMDYRSRWFSAYNVLEYYVWFNSALHFFKRLGVVPLGGNTVFFHREMLAREGGWDETCLTEDADIGIRLSARGERIEIIYAPSIATREETPPSAAQFVKQRTRWNQGFLQILGAGEWMRFGPFGQLFSVYILGWPIVQALLVPYILLAGVVALTTRLPVLVALAAFLPLIVLVLQLVIYVLALRAFTADYGLRYPFVAPFALLAAFIPFYLLLAAGAARATWRYLLGEGAWEKTDHTGAHRVMRRA